MSYMDLTAAHLICRAEQLLDRPTGALAAHLVGFELAAPPPAFAPPHGWADVVATWGGGLPSVCEIAAIGRALAEASAECRAVYRHAVNAG